MDVRLCEWYCTDIGFPATDDEFGDVAVEDGRLFTVPVNELGESQSYREVLMLLVLLLNVRLGIIFTKYPLHYSTFPALRIALNYN